MHDDRCKKKLLTILRPEQNERREVRSCSQTSQWRHHGHSVKTNGGPSDKGRENGIMGIIIIIISLLASKKTVRVRVCVYVHWTRYDSMTHINVLYVHKKRIVQRTVRLCTPGCCDRRVNGPGGHDRNRSLLVFSLRLIFPSSRGQNEDASTHGRGGTVYVFSPSPSLSRRLFSYFLSARGKNKVSPPGTRGQRKTGCRRGRVIFYNDVLMAEGRLSSAACPRARCVNTHEKSGLSLVHARLCESFGNICTEFLGDVYYPPRASLSPGHRRRRRIIPQRGPRT